MVLTGRRGRVEGVGLDHGITGSGVVPERSVLDAVASELIGKPVSVSLIMKEQQQPNVAGAETAKDEPLVKKFLEVFRGDLAQVKPSKGE